MPTTQYLYYINSCVLLLATLTSISAFSISISKPYHRLAHNIINLNAESKVEDIQAKSDDNKKPLIEPLQPFVPAMDPNYKNIGIVGDNDFIVSKTGPPLKEELSNENLYKILMIQCTDLEVNTLVWKCLGYRFVQDENGGEWNSEACFPKWREKYPTPPDLIGMQRIYSKEVDQPSLKANQSIVRSVPVDNKQSLKTHLRPLGFTGYKVSE